MNAIEFHDIGVRHPLVHRRIPTLKEWFISRASTETIDNWFWALKNVTFSVQKGDTLGIIGGNGAGKSTLLRVAAGIITPSEGEAVVRGSLAPLIELGTGFDGELTGLENIYFNGALLGRSKSEITARMPYIVEFAGIGAFIDAPLRTYSTGMVSRLAFSIATTIEPDILLLDEILSVGDATFKSKCTDRIRSFRDRGTTILLVSHDLKGLAELCAKTLWIERGTVREYGPSAEVIEHYLEVSEAAAESAGNVELPEFDDGTPEPGGG